MFAPRESPAKITEFAQLNRYHVSKVAYFLDKLKNTPDGDGNLLDHSLVLYGSPMGDSDASQPQASARSFWPAAPMAQSRAICT